MDREELISIVRNSSFYEEPYNMLDDVQTNRIINLIKSHYKEKYIEAVKACSDGSPYSDWEAGFESGIELAVKAMEKVE